MSDNKIMQSPSDFFDLENLRKIYKLQGIDRARLIGKLTIEARECGVENEFRALIKECDAKVTTKEAEKNICRIKDDILCDLDSKGRPAASIENFLSILRNDEEFESLRFNELTNTAEHSFEGNPCAKWTDADDSAAKCYIEKKYGIYSAKKYEDAFRIVIRERSYHPIRDLLSYVTWDGKSRICNFLHRWMLADDTPYTREVSRLIFAGGIHRLYNPGCKFDEMPVLIGTNQGEGKSTIVRWLAIKDEFFAEVNEFEGQRGIECLEGAWICEVSELLALTKAKEQEAVKSYLSRLNDRYRMPFDKRVTDHKRSCVFLGTTNKLQFLTDRTGNRRFYPVRVWQTAANLYEHEKEIREYILQCWAEASYLYSKGELRPYADPDIIDIIRENQAQAVQDDYRVGMIKDFLETRDEVCIPMLWYEALKMRSDTRPTRRDSNELALIMQSMVGWERQNRTKYFTDYGTQRYWRKEWEEIMCE